MDLEVFSDNYLYTYNLREDHFQIFFYSLFIFYIFFCRNKISPSYEWPKDRMVIPFVFTIHYLNL